MTEHYYKKNQIHHSKDATEKDLLTKVKPTKSIKNTL